MTFVIGASDKPSAMIFFSHRSGFWNDAWWQLCCGIVLDKEPFFEIEEEVRHDPFYRIVEKNLDVAAVWSSPCLYFYLVGCHSSFGVSVAGSQFR